jgi:hypothetical protein
MHGDLIALAKRLHYLESRGYVFTLKPRSIYVQMRDRRRFGIGEDVTPADIRISSGYRMFHPLRSVYLNGIRLRKYYGSEPIVFRTLPLFQDFLKHFTINSLHSYYDNFDEINKKHTAILAKRKEKPNAKNAKTTRRT